MRVTKHLAVVAGLGLAACTAAACSLFTDLKGLSNGDEASDAAASPDSAGTTDAGGTDAISTADGGVTRCADRSPQPLFCTDFDDATPFTDLFEKQAEGLGQAVRDPLARSGPSSMLLRQTKDFVGNCGYLQYWKDIGGPNAVVLETWIRLGDASGAYPEDGVFASISHRATSGANGCTQIFRTDKSFTKLHSQQNLPGGGTDDEFFPFKRPIAPGAWTLFRAELTADPDSSGSRVRVSLDGQVVLDQVRNACQLGTASVRLGMYCEFRKTREIRYDDVVIDAR